MNGSKHNKPVIAAFDFDGTLTRHDTLLPFLWHVAGPAKFIYKSILLSPVFAGYALKLIRNDIAKIKVLQSFLRGLSISLLQPLAREFAASTLPNFLRPSAMRQLEWHKQQGHRCILVSASLELYLQPWAEKCGFDDVLCSSLEIGENGITTGRLSGENCFGPEKLQRLENLLGRLSDYTVYAYGDSRGDRELLAAADHAYYRYFKD